MSRTLLRPPSPGPVRSGPVAVLVVGALLGTLLTGCGGGDSDGPDGAAPSPTASQSPVATASATPPDNSEEPRPVVPAARDTAGSRRQFAEFVITSWSYALRTNDFRSVTGLSPRSGPCGGCQELRTELSKRRDEGWFVDFPGTQVKEIDVRPAGAPGTFLARAKVDIPASRSFFDDGTFRNDNAAHRGATFEVRMRLDKKRYSLLAFRLI